MSVREIALRIRKKWRQTFDARGERDWSRVKLINSNFPALPSPANVSPELLQALKRDREDILAGKWHAFGKIELRVDDPPRWDKDYLANAEFPTNESAFGLNHRSLPNGGDIKLIWELSRWQQLTRLAMASYILDDEKAGRKCLSWVKDWVNRNPAYRGWNWTSALESGLRLVQFTWIDALLSENAEKWGLAEELDGARYQILPAHAWFTWRHKSFGSSANNHLLGELTGLLVAMARWPMLSNWSSSMESLKLAWEKETLAQFAVDGGNKEQALHYHLFSLELCLTGRLALLAAGRQPSSAVEKRLDAALRFFPKVQTPSEAWDYGDSDDAHVLPFPLSEKTSMLEWRAWMARESSHAIACWMGDPPISATSEEFPAKQIRGWTVFKESGIAVRQSGAWSLRWDISPLGYLATAAHGHLDALHLSAWCNGAALIVDPGTGAYYADQKLRNWLTSRQAHNAPCPEGPDWPSRAGPFLWKEQHARPRMEEAQADDSLGFALALDKGTIKRHIKFVTSSEYEVTDGYVLADGTPAPFHVRWQFAPDTRLQRISERVFLISREHASVRLCVGEDWSDLLFADTPESQQQISDLPAMEREMAGTVAPSFRRTQWAPWIKLQARPQAGRPCVFKVTFVVSAAS